MWCDVSVHCLILRARKGTQWVDRPKEAANLIYGGVAQLGEHLPCKQGVDSSILFVSTSRLAEERAYHNMGS